MNYLGDLSGGDLAPRTGSGTEDGLPAEEALNLQDFVGGTDKAETASANAPTSRADQSENKPFQDYLRWGVQGTGGDLGGDAMPAAAGAFGTPMPMNAPAAAFGGSGSSPPPSVSVPSGQNQKSAPADPSGLIAMSGPGGDIFGYAGQVSDSLAMISSAPVADSIATAGTAGDSTVVLDPNGNVTSESNPLGDATRFAYDSSGQRTAVTDALGNVTSIAYDPAGDVVSVTDPDGNTTTYDYDAEGRLVRMTDPLGHSATYAYNAAGLLASTTDRDGRRRDFFYNAAGQITAEDWYDADGNLTDQLRFGYDGLGELVSASNDEGSYTFAYDSRGRLVRETEPFGLWLAFSYDAAGDRTGVQDSFGGDTVSTYDANGNLLSRQLSAPGQTTIGVTLDYTADGEVDTLTRFAGGSVVGITQYGYDGSGNVTGIAHLDASGDVLDQFVYAYDAAGRVSSEADSGQAEGSPGLADPAVAPSDPSGPTAGPAALATAGATALVAGGATSAAPGDGSTGYTYDADGQLIGAGTQTYRYDANGNRIDPGYVIGPDNQVLSDGKYTYTYDADGNRVGKVDIATGVSWSYGYDDANQMTSAVEYAADGKTVLVQVTYAYDVFGNRLEEDTFTASTNARTVQRYGYDGQNIWADLDGSDNLETRYLYGDAVDEILARVGSDGVVAWYLTDRLGSVRDLMDDSGSVIDHRDYDAFGNIVYETDPAAGDRYGFTGRELDAATGLQYNRARYYDASIGNWTSQDPDGVNAGDPNLYRYSNNIPIDVTDPSGLSRKLITQQQPNGKVQLYALDEGVTGFWPDEKHVGVLDPRTGLVERNGQFLRFGDVKAAVENGTMASLTALTPQEQVIAKHYWNQALNSAGNMTNQLADPTFNARTSESKELIKWLAIQGIVFTATVGMAIGASRIAAGSQLGREVTTGIGGSRAITDQSGRILDSGRMLPSPNALDPRQMNVAGSLQNAVKTYNVEQIKAILRDPKKAKAFWDTLIAEGEKIDIVVLEGKMYIADGNHRFLAALEEGVNIPKEAIRIREMPKDMMNWDRTKLSEIIKR